jgi:iron complex outermembrane receptor protein
MKPSSTLIAIFLLFFCAYATAQPAASSSNSIQEIVVTAQKREQNLQSVGITMRVFDEDELAARNIQNLPEIASVIANVELFEDFPSAGIPTWIIRGVGLQDFNTNNTPTASVYVDESYLTSSIMGNVGLFDIQQLEVLKGPQGGLYGRNTTGGAVLLNTNRAVLGKNNGALRFSYGSWNNVSLEAFTNISLKDSLAWRLSGRIVSRDDAWQSSLATNSGHGEKEQWDIRSWLHYENNDDLSIEWKIQGGVNESDIDLGRTVGIYDATGSFCSSAFLGQRNDAACLSWAGFNQLVQSLPNSNVVATQATDGTAVLSDPFNQQDNDYLSNALIISKQFNSFQFSSISNFDIFNYGVNLDLDASTGEFAHRISNSDAEVFSQEFRLVSDDSQRLSWLAGINFSEEKFEERRQFLFRDNFLVIASQGLSFGNVDYDQNTSSQALYGNLRYVIDTNWAVNFSLRYTNEEKEYRNGSLYVPGAPPFVIFSNLSRDYKLEDNVSGNASLEWTPVENLLLYASIADGFKSGGFYGGFPSFPQEIDPYKEETITAYEVGFKSDISSTLRLNAAAFYYDYDDVQGFVSRLNVLTNTVINVLSNQGEAEHSGVEAELNWRPTEAFNVGLNIGYLDATIKESGVTSLDIFQNVVSVAGRRPYAPLWSGDFNATYQFSLLQDFNAAASLFYNFRTDFSGSQPNLVEEAIYRLDGYDTVNVNVDLYHLQDDWNLSFWINNLFDESYRTRVKSDGLLSYADFFGQTRSVGASLELRW